MGNVRPRAPRGGPASDRGDSQNLQRWRPSPLSHDGAELARHVRAEERNAEDLHQDRRKRDQARARVLPRVWHADFCGSSGRHPSSYGLRVGALDPCAELRPSRQGWCRSALPWSMDLTGVERFERQP